MEDELKHLIFYAITEKLYFQMKTTNYTSFGLMCRGIRGSFINELPLSTECYRVFTETGRHIQELYALSFEESTEIMLEYFKGKEWDTYQEVLQVLLCHTKNSFQ